MTIERMIEEQARKWQQATDRRKKKQEPTGPVITISREPGSEGHVLAKKIAEELKIDLFDREIIHQVSKSANMSERVVQSLDEKERSILDNWIQFLKTSRWFWGDEYVHHLTKVIGTIHEHGNAVILGRGANMVLPPEETLRLRFVAPFDVRIQNISKEQSISQEKAKQYIYKEESDRKAFVRKYFHTDIDDSVNYDMVINTHYLTHDQIINIVTASLKFKKLPARRRFDPKPEGKA
ncbi:MAG: cytidylate kinase-like family protein [Deltaproteobacteria bacterium]|nr:cytidylate kinase-like family protein [Deltaproteobacteria bacterium]MBN2688532.1 cytidylate kinase-like family protein [Deltaproteobacteria bacterium]